MHISSFPPQKFTTSYVKVSLIGFLASHCWISSHLLSFSVYFTEINDISSLERVNGNVSLK